MKERGTFRLSPVFLLAVALAAQQPEPSVKFSATSNLVVVDVTVRDRSGKVIEGLKKQDFTVLEDGKPQNIQVFEFQKLGAEQLPLQPPALKNVALTPKPAVISVASPGAVQYQDKRLLVFFFDMSSMQVPEELRAQQAALKFLDEQMTASDAVCIMTFSQGLRIEQDFTTDREALRDTINAFRIGEMSEFSLEADDADENAGEDTNAPFIADESEFNIFNTDRKLAGLESAVKKLALLPEKKALVYFSAGVGKTGVENQSQLKATVNAAVRANVAFYPVDTRGLQALPPGGDASKAAPRGTGIFSGNAQRTLHARFNDQQETLATLAADTGGKAFLDSNDLTMGIVQAQKDVRSYYILGYYSSNVAEDGRFRRFTVKLNGGQQARLEHRPGYFGPKKFGQFDSSDKERQLEEALGMGDPFTDLRLALQVDYFRIDRDQYFVPVSLKIPGSNISLKKRGAGETTEFDFIGQILDDKRKLAGSVRDGIRVKLNEEDAAKVAERSFQYDCGFTLASGRYRIKMVARDNQSGKIGTFETRFAIPDLQMEVRSVKMSSVVLGSQREPLRAAVGAAEKQKKLLASNPLVEGGQKLIPNITKVFRKDQSLFVYAEVYEPVGDPNDRTPAVSAVLSMYRGSAKTFESDPVHLKTGARADVLPIRFQVPLGKLKPGQYVCQLNVVDEVGRRFAFRRSPVVVVGEKERQAARLGP